MAGFLDNLKIAECSLCRCYFFTWSSWYDSDGEKHGKTYVELNRIKQFNWVHDDPDETNPFEIVERRMKVEATYKTRRYLCINCVKELSAISADKAQV